MTRRVRTALLGAVAAGWAALALLEAVRGDGLGMAMAAILHVASMVRLWGVLRRSTPAA
jgi:hypothetical protein